MDKRDKWMHRSYWKAIGVLIFIYVIIGGLSTPLKPGIVNASSEKSLVYAGQSFTLNVTGYNTHFKEGGELQAWLKLDTLHFLKASSVEVSNDNIANLSFTVPTIYFESKAIEGLTLITYNEKDGTAILPDAISFSKPSDLDSNIINNAIWVSSLPVFTQNSAILFPYRNILNETIRNTFFHVALWLAMVILLLAGLYHAIFYLKTKDLRHDKLSAAYNTSAILYGILGLVTGSIWAKYTWGTWWTTDVKLNMAAIAMLIYLAYFILRGSNTDFDKRARISAAYSIFSFAALIPLIFIIPRMTASLHPGNGGNPALGGEDLDNTLRLFFYPSIISFILLGVWMATLNYRAEVLNEKQQLKSQN
jgi:heme exporter protein C